MNFQNFQQKMVCNGSESNGNYSHENPIKFLTTSIESGLCVYSDAYILVTGDISV